jgi:hypothetical protein
MVSILEEFKFKLFIYSYSLIRVSTRWHELRINLVLVSMTTSLAFVSVENVFLTCRFICCCWSYPYVN